MSVECRTQLVAVKVDSYRYKYVGCRTQAVLIQASAGKIEEREKRKRRRQIRGNNQTSKENRSPGGGDEKRTKEGRYGGAFRLVAPDHEACPIGSWISCQRKSWHMLQGPTRGARPRKPLESWRASWDMNGQPWTDEIMLRGAEESVPADLRPAFAVENEDIRAPGGIGIQTAGTWPRLWQTLSLPARGRALMHDGSAV